MNISTSEYSSGCESGWTMYLDQLSNSSDPYGMGCYAEDEEDQSMVSDASSGPPHFREDTQYCIFTSPSISQDKKKNKQKTATKEARPVKQQNLCLDDTASSPFFDFSQGNVAPSGNRNSVQVFSGAHFEGEAIKKKHLSFFNSSTKGKSGLSGTLLGRKRQ